MHKFQKLRKLLLPGAALAIMGMLAFSALLPPQLADGISTNSLLERETTDVRTASANFQDVDDEDHGAAIDYLFGRQVVRGYSDGTYRPDEAVQRSELLTMIMSSLGYSGPNERCFDDVELDQWYTPVVCGAKNRGIIFGYNVVVDENLTLNEAQVWRNINAVEAFAMLHRAFVGEIDTSGEVWYDNLIQEANANQLISSDIVSPSHIINRAQAAELVTRYLRFSEGTLDEYLDSVANAQAEEEVEGYRNQELDDNDNDNDNNDETPASDDNSNDTGVNLDANGNPEDSQDHTQDNTDDDHSNLDPAGLPDQRWCGNGEIDPGETCDYSTDSACNNTCSGYSEDGSNDNDDNSDDSSDTGSDTGNNNDGSDTGNTGSDTSGGSHNMPGMTGTRTPSPLPSGTVSSNITDAERAASFVPAQPENIKTGPAVNQAARLYFRCFFSHAAYDDPIVFYDQPGASHFHLFFGNRETDASSTTESLFNGSEQSTCLGGRLNRTAYWVPAPMDASGNHVVPPSDEPHFMNYSAGVGTANNLEPFPQALRMIAGVASSTTPQDRQVMYWDCLNNPVGGVPYIPTCRTGDTLILNVVFPQCWNGRDLDSPNHRSHMAYPTWDPTTSSVRCPLSHPRVLPEVSMQINYPVTAANAGAAGSTAGWSLVSDTYDTTNTPGGYSAHADWFNGWDPQTIDYVVRNCLQAGMNCNNGVMPDENDPQGRDLELIGVPFGSGEIR